LAFVELLEREIKYASLKSQQL